MRFMANHHDAEDVLSIAFVKVFRKIETFEYRGEGSLKKWIKTIVINESIRYIKQKKDLRYENDPLFFETEMHTGTDLYPADLDVDKVYQIISEMPVGYRTVFNLYAIEGYSHQEIADLLKISEGTSKSQLSKARNHIIHQLKKFEVYAKP